MTDAEIQALLAGKPAVSPMIAGRLLGLGRRRTENAVKSGEIPTLPGGMVSAKWLRSILGIDQQSAA